jgi:hypothetical protein
MWWLARDTVVMTLATSFFSSTCQSCTRCCSHWPGNVHTHRTNFDSGIGFLVLDRSITCFLSEDLFNKRFLDSKAFSLLKASLNRCLHFEIPRGSSRLHWPVACLFLGWTASCVFYKLLVPEFWVCVEVRLGYVIILTCLLIRLEALFRTNRHIIMFVMYSISSSEPTPKASCTSLSCWTVSVFYSLGSASAHFWRVFRKPFLGSTATSVKTSFACFPHSPTHSSWAYVIECACTPMLVSSETRHVCRCVAM